MKSSNTKKTVAIIKLKLKMLMNNTAALTGPLMAVGMTVVMKFLYTSLADGDLEVMDSLMGMALNFGLAFNIGMGTIMMTALPLAEDKEKYTLRALMTSSVNGKQFFIGSIIPPFVISVIINYVLVFISGVNIANVDFVIFSIVTITGTLISCMIGLLIGIIAKSQVNANNIMTPFIMILSLIPTFATLNTSIAAFSDFLYTGITSNMINSFVVGEVFNLQIQQIIILVVSVVLFTFLFMYFYKKNGLESD